VLRLTPDSCRFFLGTRKPTGAPARRSTEATVADRIDLDDIMARPPRGWGATWVAIDDAERDALVAVVRAAGLVELSARVNVGGRPSRSTVDALRAALAPFEADR
jgi:hypothetical protein